MCHQLRCYPDKQSGFCTTGYYAILNYFLLLLFIFNIQSAVIAQTDSLFTLRVHKSPAPVIPDGMLTEPVWQSAEEASDFFQNYPFDTSLALSRTQVQLTYDEKNLYIGAVCQNLLKGNFIIHSLKRDFPFEDNDGFAVFIDPFDDKANGYAFAVNPYGVQREGLIESGSTTPVSDVWDNKWTSKVKILDDKWIIEMAIPLKTIKYKSGNNRWRINFARNDLKRNERSTWVPVPKNFKPSSLGHTGILIWDTPPEKSGLNAALIPYSISGLSHKYPAGQNTKPSFNAGADAKIAVTSSLNLDATANPDFSQIEVDQQQVNLTRFNILYPEKRQFFIENSDLFANFGFSQIRPFFSRKIGLYQGEPVPIIAGMRLSGKTGQKTRIGLMDVQTANKNSSNMEAQNYFVSAFQRQVFGRSNISGIFVNRQAIDSGKTSPDAGDYNRVTGLDFNLLSDNNRWQGKIFYHTSFTPENYNRNFATATWLMYNTKNLFWMWNHEYVGKNYLADAGFVPRNITVHHETGMAIRQTYFRLEPMVKLQFYPSSGIVNYHGPALYSDDYFDEDMMVTDYFFMPHYIVNFLNTSEFQVHFHEFFTKLFYETDISFSGKKPIPAGNYHYRNLMVRYQSDKRQFFSYFIQGLYGSQYNGTLANFKVDLNYRIQPRFNFSLGFYRDIVDLPVQYEDFIITLVTQKAEFTFTPSLYFTVFTQYNTQINNMNINVRFQWRFLPMSDFYIVYTENYSSGNLKVKDRAVVAKLIWWLAL